MNDRSTPSLAELIKDTALITAAVNRSSREAVLKQARAGHAVADWQDGKIVWITPEEILARYGP